MSHSHVASLVAEFMDYLAADGEVNSPQTVDWYRSRLGLFTRWAGDPLSRRAFRAYVADLRQRPRQGTGNGAGLSPYTVRGHVNVLRRFGRWLAEEGYRDDDPAARLKPPRPLRDVPPKSVPKADIPRLIEAADTPRDRAMVAMLRDTGARAGELMELHWRDVDLDRGLARVVGKGQKHRPVFFKSSTARALAAYRDTAPHELDDPVWWGRKGPLTYQGLVKLLRRLAEKAGVSGPYNPHAWRHAYGRDVARNGCPTLVQQDLMGHSSPKVTRVYTAFQEEDELRELYRRYAPDSGLAIQPWLPGLA